MFADLRILTAPASDTPVLPPLFVRFGAEKYLFNAGEGTSRSCTQRKANLSRVANIFVPRVGWEAIGGLPGILMSQADGNRVHSRVHGPTNLRYAVAAMRSYAKRDTMQLSINEIDVQPSSEAIFEDDNVKVYAVPLLSQGFEASSAGSGTQSRANKKPRLASNGKGSVPTSDAWKERGFQPSNLTGEAAQDYIRSVSESMFNDSLVNKQDGPGATDMDTEMDIATKPEAGSWKPPRSPAFIMGMLPPPSSDLVDPKSGGQAPVFAYICEGHPQRGKFDPQQAAQAGVAPGPGRAALTRGEDVTIQRPRAWASMNAEARDKWLLKDKFVKPGGANKQKNKKGKQAPAPAAVEEPKQDPPEWADVEEVVVGSQDVMGPSRAGAVFCQMYLPSADYIPSLFTPDVQAAFHPFTLKANAGKPAEQLRTPHVMIHAVPQEVFEDPGYREWMNAFGPDCNHIVANREVCANKLQYPSCSTIPLRLSRVDPVLYAVPQYQIKPRVKLPKEDGQLRLFAAEADQFIQLHPRGTPVKHHSGAPDFDFALDSEEAEKLAAFETEEVDEPEQQQQQQAAQLNKAKAKNKKGGDAGSEEAAAAEIGAARQLRLKETRKQAWTKYLDVVKQLACQPVKCAADDVRITTLGTGSASPSKYRNVISTLIQTPNDGNVLLDAGEATYGLLKRKFGSKREGTAGAGVEDVDQVLRNLKLLFISHIHADHHIGLIQILRERRRIEGRSSPLYLVGTALVHNYLREHNRVERLGLDEDVVLLNSAHLDWRTGVDPLEGSGRTDMEAIRQTSDAAKAALGLAYVHTARVAHRGAHCYGMVLRHLDGWSIVYSGDTRPCASLINAGRDATLLIHEATLDDSEAEMAVAKGHSTFGEAMRVARDMGVSNLLLTHFSQRYPKMALSRGFRDRAIPTVLAFDGVTFPLREFSAIQRYLPALEVLFSDEAEGEGDATAEAPRPPAVPR